MPRVPHRPVLASVVAAVTLLGATVPAGIAASAAAPRTSPTSAPAAAPAVGTRTGARAPQPGARGIGDPLYPGLGNGGYDATHYALRLRYATRAPSQGIDGTLVMRARATQSLSRFDLDFAGDSFGAVRVDGRPAKATRRGEELVVTPRRPIRRGARFVVVVRHFVARPRPADPTVFLGDAFVQTSDGSVVAGQPNLAHAVFPCNDHPRDKARYTITFDVPKGETAVANGVLTHRRTHGSRTRWTYEQRQPMATELVQLAVGSFTVVRRGHVGRTAVRDVVPTRFLRRHRSLLGVETSQLRWMTSRVGAYPFRTYGSLVVKSPLGFALETQTLSLYDDVFFRSEAGYWKPVLLHELAHQWFGDSVAPYNWSDVWLNEGHATWYQLGYAADRGYLEATAGETDLTSVYRNVYAGGDQLRADFGPVARPLSGDPKALFNPNVYDGGALVLYALRQRIGKRDFARVERAWVRRERGRSASTETFIRLAARVSGDPGVRPFLRSWLYDTTTPPMPGHPGWTVDPVTSDTARSSGRTAKLLGRPLVRG